MKNLLSVIGSAALLILAIVAPNKNVSITAQSKSIQSSAASAGLNCGGNGTGGL